MPPLLRMTGVSKRFGATCALEGVTFSVERGQVHALIGENGAGKSTLMKILAGVHAPDAGSMEVDGRAYAPSGPAAARGAGVAMIHQELSIAPDLDVEANVLLGQERSRAGFVRRGEQRRVAREALARLSHPDLDLGARAGELPIALQQVVEIARALVSEARVLVLDEPTSSLTREDALRLFEVIRDLRAQGLGLVYISHFLEEVARVSDVYSVLRDGRVVASGEMRDATQDAIVRAMVGRDLGEMFPRVPHEPGEPILELRGLSGLRSPRGVDLVVRRGEILGLAGLVGAGRSELLRCVFGLDAVRSGSVRVAAIGPVGESPRRSIARGLGFVSEDRKGEGLATALSIEENLTLTRLAPFSRLGWLSLSRRRRAAREWMDRVRCKAAGPEQAVEALSGGNQQKIAIARLLHQEADVLLLDEPTRGIDVGTKAEIYRLIGELAAQKKAIVLVSSYLPELLGTCDRVGVLCRGELRDVRPVAGWTEEDVMRCATDAAAPAAREVA
jgi:ribose transport system ATP-binding protein